MSDQVSIKAALRKAELRKALAEADAAEYEAAMKKIALRDAELMDEIANSGDNLNNVFKLYGEVGDDSIASIESGMISWSRRHPGEEVTIRLYSPGGSVFSGLVLFDSLSTLKEQGHRVKIVVRGMAASMGAVLLQAADERVIGSESLLMIHEVASSAYGTASEIGDAHRFVQKLNRRMAEILSSRSGKSPEQLLEMMARKDVWMSSSEAIAIGLADRIG